MLLKKLFLLGLLAISVGSTFGQAKLTLMQVDSVLDAYISRFPLRSSVIQSKSLIDSVAIYQLYIRLDLDGVNHQLKEVKFSDPCLGVQLFPHLEESLSKEFDFTLFTSRKKPITTVLIPVFFVLTCCDSYKGDFEKDIKTFYTGTFLSDRNRLLKGVTGRYYVLTTGFDERINTLIYF